MSDLVLKRCKENSSSNAERKKFNKIKASLRKVVLDPEVITEAEKKGRKASESNSQDDDSSSTKSIRMISH